MKQVFPYTSPVLRFLHSLSAPLFYLLGLTIVAAYAALRANEVWGVWWLQVVDLPFLFAGVLYGSTSMYHSLPMEKPSWTLMLGIFIPATLIFLTFVVLNFWTPLLGSSLPISSIF